MKLSVIIPVRDVENTLEKCLESVVKQNVPNMEIILVDDGGEDNCPEMCDNLARLYNHESATFCNVQVIVIHTLHLGLSSARNSGMEVATGDYFTFVDSDDFVGSGVYSKVLNYLSVHPDVDIAEYGVAERYNNPQLRSVLRLPDKIYYDKYEYWFDTEAYKHTYAWNKIYKRHLFDDVRYPVGQSFEDIDVLPKLLDRAKKIATMSIGSYFYSWNNKGITATAGRKQLLEHLLAGVRSLKWVTEEYYNTDRFIKLYVSVLNTQILLYNRTHGCLCLPYYNFGFLQIYKAYCKGMSKENLLKMLMLKTLRLKRFCATWRILTRLKIRLF